VKILYPLDDEGDRDDVLRFVKRFEGLPIRSTGQHTAEFFALVREALRTGEIDARLQVIARRV